SSVPVYWRAFGPQKPRASTPSKTKPFEGIPMNVLGLFQLSPMEILIILGLGVLLFVRKLPEVGKYLGKGIVEFKKGLRGMEDDVDAGHMSAPRQDPAA